MLFCYFPGISLGPVQKPKVSKTMPLFSQSYSASLLMAAEGKGARFGMLEKSQPTTRGRQAAKPFLFA